MTKKADIPLRTYALGAGVFFFLLAVFVQGVLPFLEPQSRWTKVTKVVRTDLGELKWMEDHAADFTPKEERGRRVYIREGCWYCHSQYVRPVTGETRRWGPVTQSGEYAYDLPHLFSTRRIGPDLSRVGLKYSDAWHLAHFWSPRMVVPDSIMPRLRKRPPRRSSSISPRSSSSCSRPTATAWSSWPSAASSR
jgi:cytochrome c oxidase cbb3-type subunit 2